MAGGVLSLRVAGPVALLVAATAVALVVRNAVHDGPQAPPPAAATPLARPAPARPRVRRPAAPREVVVRPGDTLSAIAARTRTTVAALIAANPGIRPESLRAGQRIRLTAAHP